MEKMLRSGMVSTQREDQAQLVYELVEWIVMEEVGT